MHIARHTATAACAAALLLFASVHLHAASVVFSSINRQVEATATLANVPQSDLKESTAAGAFNQTASKSITAGNTSITSTASQDSFLNTSQFGSSGLLQLSLTGASATDGATARSLFETAFQVNEPFTFAMRANMSGDGNLPFSGKLKLERSSLVLLDTELTTAQPEASQNSELPAGQYFIRFEPLMGTSGGDGAGSARYALFGEATVIPLPPAAWAALAPLLLIAWKTARRHFT